MEKAIEILDEMTLAGISPNEHTYTTIMHGYASLGDTGKAFEYFTKLRNEGLELDVFTYEALLKACCKSGRMQSALAVTKEMSAQKIPRNTFVYNILIDGYERFQTMVPPCHFFELFSFGRCLQYEECIYSINSFIFVSYLLILLLLFFFQNTDGLEEVMFGRLLTLCNK